MARFLPRSAFLQATILIGMSFSPFAAARPAAAGGPVYQEDFQDGEAQGWTLESGWQLVQDGADWFLEGSGHAWARSGVTLGESFRLTLRVRLVPGRVHLVIRNNDVGRYFIGLDSNGSDLNRQEWPNSFHNGLATSPRNHTPNTWHTVEVIGEGARLRVLVDGKEELRYTDPAPLQGGSFAFETLDASAVDIDDIALYDLTSAVLSPTVSSPASPLSTPAATSKPGMGDLRWVRLGGPAGGLGYDIRMRPDNPDVMFVTDAWAGVHKSTDGGRTWVPANQGITGRLGESGDAIPVFCLTIDPNNYDVTWAGLQNLGQLYRSTDSGLTWEKRAIGILEGEGLTFRGISIQPGNSNIVYAAGEISPSEWAGRELKGLSFDLTKGVVYKSTDGGLHWVAIWRGDNLARYVWIDPADVKTLYLSTGIFDREAANSNPKSNTPGGVGVLKSTDGGKTWRQINNGLGNLYIGSLFMHPTNPNILLAGAGNISYLEGSGIYLTTDGGAHWRLVQDTAPVAVTAVEFSASDPNIAYAGGQHVFSVSTDGGHTWLRRERGYGRWGPLGVAPGFPIDFQVDPRDPMRLFANNYGGGNFLTEDGGKTWISTNTGYTGADLRSLSVHPDFAATVYVNGRSGPFVSLDGGIDWQGLNPENLAPIVEGSQISLDPSNPKHVLMTESNRDLIYWSDDGGGTWKEATGDTAAIREKYGQFIGGVEALAYAPSRPSRVYAVFGNNGCRGMGLGCDSSEPVSTFAVSNDGGRSWTHPAGTPHDHMPGTAVIVHPSDADRVWIAVPDFGVYTTSDGGSTWQSSSRGLGSAKVMSLAIDGSNPDTLYAGTLAQGVYKSLDGGGTWRSSSRGMDPNEPVYTLVVDPVRPSIIYAGSLRSGVFRSEDGGQTWIAINAGLRTRSVHDLAISADGGTLYAGTRGEGVFRLDLAGHPPEAAPTERPAEATVATTPGATVATTAGAEATPTPAAPSAGRPGLCASVGLLPLLFVAVAQWRRRTGKR